jgi:DNA repair photolyase
LESRDIDIDYNRDREDPKDPKDTEKPPVEGSSPKSSLSLKVGSSGSFGSDGEPDADLLGSGRGSGRGSDPAEVQKCIGPHPRREEQSRLKAIYVSSGPAREYAEYSLNLHNGCSHGCKYCYAQKRFSGDCTTRVKKARLENIEDDLKGWKGERKPVHLTFMGDPYDLGREDNSDVRAVLELFKKYRHPFQVLTKGGEKAVDDFDLYFEGCRFGCTLTFMDEKDSRHWEPGAALPIGRIAALKEAHDRGIETWVSLEPIIDPCQTLALIDASYKYVDHYGVGKWNHDERANMIVWPVVRAEAETRLKKYGKSYMIKEDLRKAAPDADSTDANADNSEKIRAAAIVEYGTNGWVDPVKIANDLKLHRDEVEAWLQANYVAYDRPGSGVGYRQRKAGEGAPA